MIRCVVIDDDPKIREVFCELLTLIGVKVLATGKDGKDAEIEYEKHHPDVVFLDLQMPKFDGYYAIEKIRTINPDAKIIVATSDLKAKESVLLDSYNVTSIIYKPFNMHTVKQVLTNTILIHTDDSFR